MSDVGGVAMYGGLSRNEVRSFFCEAWRKHLASDAALSPIEQVTIEWIMQHPEWHPLLEIPREAMDRDYAPENGATNPFLHLSLHLAISEQVAADSPKGIRQVYYTLIRKKGSEHSAAHEVMECLGEAIWRSQKHGKPLDNGSYIKCLDRIARK